MKKVLSFLIVLLLSFCVSVNAENDIVIKNISVESKTEYEDSEKEIVDVFYSYTYGTELSSQGTEPRFTSEEECEENLSILKQKDSYGYSGFYCKEFTKKYDGKVTYEVEEESSFKDSQIDLLVNLHEVDDYIKYRIELKNNSSNDILINNSLFGLNTSGLIEREKWCLKGQQGSSPTFEDCLLPYTTFYTEIQCETSIKKLTGYDTYECYKTEENYEINYNEYIDYSISGDTLIKANSTGTVYLTIKYNNYIHVRNCDEPYFETQNISLLYDENQVLVADTSEENPDTNSGTYLVISLILILTIILILLTLHKNQNFKRYFSLILILLGIIAIISPLLVVADNENKITININSSVDNNLVCAEYDVNNFPLSNMVLGKVGMNWEENYLLGVYYDVECDIYRSNQFIAIITDSNSNSLISLDVGTCETEQNKEYIQQGNYKYMEILRK